ncbi:structural maintenance of chromosomes protein 5 [Notothenia coriiceps]|uniref:Structural maintenance of chromosomes protein 5 n=1 Tax=Notothenia coriiceps TaxID=8208 RepID=A0A6I9PX83_9TELE|nr:PREDICTED: structural maintenance of chromosomes protein 5 [Notothenia coriiceps]
MANKMDTTYDYSVVHPGANLNMIVGANGTGKSSIVCAICLGLAGKAAILGRGDKVGLYVKRGCNKGFVEIELYKTEGNVVIHREIHVENNQSLWMLDGKICSQKAVEEVVKALQIQVSNLCQFLPQEKVWRVCKMSKIEVAGASRENIVKEGKASFLEKAKQRNERNKHDVKLSTTKRRDHLDKRRAPMLKEDQADETSLNPLRPNIKGQTDAIKEASLKCKQKKDQLDRKNKEIENIKQTQKIKQFEAADHQKGISNTRRTIDAFKAELAKVTDQPDVMPQINAVNIELRQIREQRAQIEGEKSDLRRDKDNLHAETKMLERKLRDMNNMMNVKEEKLRGRHRDSHAALQWLRRNRQVFEGNVHEPMMLVINVKDPRFAKYVENHISFADLRAFVFQRKGDMEKFMKEVRDKMNLRVNAICAPEVSCSNKQSSRNIESLKHFGFFAYLREMFDAPDEVMSYLCQQYKVHDVPVGNEQTKAMIKRVIEEPYLKVLYTTEERYTLKRSHYSNSISTSNSAVYPSQYLSITVDAKEKLQLEQQMKECESKLRDIDERLKALQAEAVTLDRRDNELLAEKKSLSEVKGKRRQLEQKISSKQDSLRQMEQNVIDLQTIEVKTKEKVAAVNQQKVSLVAGIMEQMKLKVKLTMEKVYLTLETVGLMAQKSKLENDCRESASELQTTDQTCIRLEQRKVQLTELCKGLMKKAKSICRMQHDESLPEELHKAFSTLPDTLDDIDTMLNEERSRAECFTGLSENVRAQKNCNCHPIKSSLSYQEEYDKYGIRIRVKFHSSTQLHELTAYHQSGGERSVSTMLYLMALQELNRCPFRVVDEINQGMDPVNERRVFDIVVRTACKETTSQYFFITPKLLPNLQYADEMTVLCVHNGSQMLPPNLWDEKAFIRRALRRQAKP